MTIASFIIGVVAFLISAWTAYLTWWDRGKIKMTQPAVVFFGPDCDGRSKVFLRTLLYSTARRGQWIESMYATLKQGDEIRHFNVWVYGETKVLVRGSGLHVGYEGMAANHHFLLPKNGSERYQFYAGAYTLEVNAKLVNVGKVVRLWSQELSVEESEQLVLLDGRGGLYFDWDPDAKSYMHNLDTSLGGSQFERAMVENFRLLEE